MLRNTSPVAYQENSLTHVQFPPAYSPTKVEFSLELELNSLRITSSTLFLRFS